MSDWQHVIGQPPNYHDIVKNTHNYYVHIATDSIQNYKI